MKFTDSKVRRLAGVLERRTQVKWLDGYANPGDGGRYLMFRGGGMGGAVLKSQGGKSAAKKACVFLLAALLESDRQRGTDALADYPFIAELDTHLRPGGEWIAGFADIAADGTSAVPYGGVSDFSPP